MLCSCVESAADGSLVQAPSRSEPVCMPLCRRGCWAGSVVPDLWLRAGPGGNLDGGGGGGEAVPPFQLQAEASRSRYMASLPGRGSARLVMQEVGVLGHLVTDTSDHFSFI